jgi:hypothetical protein
VTPTVCTPASHVSSISEAKSTRYEARAPASRCHLDEPDRVRGVGRPDHQHEVALGGHLLHGLLTVLRGVADVVARRRLQPGEPVLQLVHGRQGLVDRERGLRQPDDLLRVAHLDVRDVVGAVDELDVLRGLTGGALDLLVTAVADQQDVVVVAREPLGLLVHLGDQRAGRVDRAQATVGRFLVHSGRDAVGAEHHHGTLGHLVGLLHEHRPAPLEGGHDVLVVDDLLAHVHRCPVDLQCPLDGDHRAVHTGAVPPGVGEEDASALISHAPMVGGDRPPPPRAAARRPRARGAGHVTSTTARVYRRCSGLPCASP